MGVSPFSLKLYRYFTKKLKKMRAYSIPASSPVRWYARIWGLREGTFRPTTLLNTLNSSGDPDSGIAPPRTIYSVVKAKGGG